MIAVTIHKAKTQFSSLIKRAEAGEDIVIVRGHHPAARLTATKRDKRSLRPKVELRRSEQRTYLLWHVHEFWAQEDDAKLIGVYATKADAKGAQRRAIKLPGFRQHPKGFLIDECEVGKDHWTTGFLTVSPGTKLKHTRANAATARRVPYRKRGGGVRPGGTKAGLSSP